MAIKGKLMTYALAAALLVPVASATWGSYGTQEPNHQLDVPSFMWEDPPGAATKRIYFNAYQQIVWGGPNGGSVNVNSDAIGSRFQPVGSSSLEAVFGVWMDCNGDGYIGMAETAVREYRSELLPAGSICAPQTGAPRAWSPGSSHNYNGWVTELIPIANRQWDKAADTRVYPDPEAKVWGDPGLPSTPAAPPQEPGCPSAFPQKRENPNGADSGTPYNHDRSLGAFVQSADCNQRREPSIVQTWDSALGGAGLGWGADPEGSASPLNYNFGNDHSDNSIVKAQDCSQEPTVGTGTSTFPGEDLDERSVLRPVPGNPVNPDGNVPGTLNYTLESIPAFGNPRQGKDWNCDFEDDAGRDFYGQVESNPAVGNVNGKNAATWNFNFNTATRGSLPVNFIHGSGSGAASTDYGIEALGTACIASSCSQSMWLATSTVCCTTPAVVRGDTTETELAHGVRYTFYAAVGAKAADFGLQTPGGSRAYGVDQCGALQSGFVEGQYWDCNPNNWYRRADGTLPPEDPANPSALRAKVHDLYQFRDVDCYDGGTDLGVGIFPAFYGANPC